MCIRPCTLSCVSARACESVHAGVCTSLPSIESRAARVKVSVDPLLATKALAAHSYCPSSSPGLAACTTTARDPEQVPGDDRHGVKFPDTDTPLLEENRWGLSPPLEERTVARTESLSPCLRLTLREFRLSPGCSCVQRQMMVTLPPESHLSGVRTRGCGLMLILILGRLVLNGPLVLLVLASPLKSLILVGPSRLLILASPVVLLILAGPFELLILATPLGLLMLAGPTRLLMLVILGSQCPVGKKW